MRHPKLAVFAAVLLQLAWCVSAAHAEGSVVLPYAIDGGLAAWHVQVAGTRVAAVDARGGAQWSLSPSSGRAAGCDGVTQLTLLLEDRNGDGLIDAARGEQARLFVASSWRDGEGWQSALLGLDVSRPGTPQVLWRQDGDTLAWLARLVAAPTVTRLPLRGTEADADGYALLLGAGLPSAATTTHAARDGAALLLLDARTGTLLWSGAASQRASQRLPTLRAGVSGGVTALDLDHDGRVDRLYVGDAAATVWRFDVAPDARPAALLAGGPLARLASAADPTARSIIAAPDGALLSAPAAAAGTAVWFNIAVGTVHVPGNAGATQDAAVTGNAGVAAGSATSQALFVVRDHHPFTALAQAQYDAFVPVTAQQLAAGDTGDGYAIDTGSDGSVARAFTAAGVLLYTQVSGNALDACAPAASTVIVKFSEVSATDGSVAADLNHDGRRDAADRAVALDAGSASPFDGPQLAPTPGPAADFGCRIGATMLTTCPAPARLQRRYWRREDAD